MFPDPPLILAEVAQAHDGSLGMAHAFIDAAADAAAGGIKFQTHIAAAESTFEEPWRVRFSRQDETRYDYWRRMEFTESQWVGLRQHARDRGLWFVSSPFSGAAVELLERVDLDAWKVASGEVGNLPLLKRIAATGKPVLLSSGMSPMAELDRAVATLEAEGAPVAVLQCTSAYPTPPEKVGLEQIQHLASRYGVPTGLSDHSGTIFPGIAAVALGADVVEVHVTLSRAAFGPDVVASVTFEELAELTRGARFIRTALDHPVDKDRMAETLAPMRELFTRSVVAARDLRAGKTLEAGDLVAKKPGTGIPARSMETLYGRRLARDVAADRLLASEDLEAG